MDIWPGNCRSRWLAWQHILFFLMTASALLAGCSALLPSSKEETIMSWDHFEQVKSAYDKISLGESRADLKELGFDVENSPNIQILSYLDVASKVQSIPMAELDTSLKQCLQSREECLGYVIDLRKLRAKRVGNFWADFFNFKRKTDNTGWRFNVLLVMINDQVTYKLWSGTPKIELYEEKRNPLGPLQGSGVQVNGLLPWQ
jgi:hypothetical protein